MGFLKLVRLVLTALLALMLAMSMVRGSGDFISSVVLCVLFAVVFWLVPYVFMRERAANTVNTPNTKRAVGFRAGFDPDIRHDNIALDTRTDTLWIRDASGAERYLKRPDLLSWKTAHDERNGTFRQRIEIDVPDLKRPRWSVLFQRHSDTWIKSSRKNGQERDEWFARLRAWSQQAPDALAQIRAQAAQIDLSLPSLHRQYYQARTDGDRNNLLVAFDITCDTDDLDQKAEWERLGGSYPGPSSDLLKFGKAAPSA